MKHVGISFILVQTLLRNNMFQKPYEKIALSSFKGGGGGLGTGMRYLEQLKCRTCISAVSTCLGDPTSQHTN